MYLGDSAYTQAQIDAANAGGGSPADYNPDGSINFGTIVTGTSPLSGDISNGTASSGDAATIENPSTSADGSTNSTNWYNSLFGGGTATQATPPAPTNTSASSAINAGTGSGISTGISKLLSGLNLSGPLLLLLLGVVVLIVATRPSTRASSSPSMLPVPGIKTVAFRTGTRRRRRSSSPKRKPAISPERRHLLEVGIL